MRIERIFYTVYLYYQGLVITLCFEPQENQTIGPPLIRVVNGMTVAGGLVLELSIRTILIEWSDGWQQRVPVVDGLYFAQRPGQGFSIDKWDIIDTEP
jgi:hypothetical protein